MRITRPTVSYDEPAPISRYCYDVASCPSTGTCRTRPIRIRPFH